LLPDFLSRLLVEYTLILPREIDVLGESQVAEAAFDEARTSLEEKVISEEIVLRQVLDSLRD